LASDARRPATIGGGTRRAVSFGLVCVLSSACELIVNPDPTLVPGYGGQDASVSTGSDSGDDAADGETGDSSADAPDGLDGAEEEAASEGGSTDAAAPEAGPRDAAPRG
jgi:hypothetical protein